MASSPCPKAVKRDIRQFSVSKPVVLIPHPIYDNYGEIATRKEALAFLKLPETKNYLLFFGFIRAYKGLDLLIQAMALKQVQQLQLTLIVAGEFYGDQGKYLKLIDQLGLMDQIILKSDYIPNEEVRYYFAAADLIVQPYRSATQSGISQLAYHFEKPMVVTNVGGLPDIIKHKETGYVVEVNPEDIADAIVDYFTKMNQEAMIEGVRSTKRHFSWGRMVEGIQDLSKQVRHEGAHKTADTGKY